MLGEILKSDLTMTKEEECMSSIFCLPMLCVQSIVQATSELSVARDAEEFFSRKKMDDE